MDIHELARMLMPLRETQIPFFRFVGLRWIAVTFTAIVAVCLLLNPHTACAVECTGPLRNADHPGRIGCGKLRSHFGGIAERGGRWLPVRSADPDIRGEPDP